MNRRQWIHAALCGAAMALPAASSAAAGTYPERPITLVVAYTQGGPTDIGARLFAAKLGEVLRQSVIVDNRAGAAGRIGTEYVARAKADGYTLLFANSTTHGLLSASTQPLPYDPVASFTPIAPLFQYTSALVCNPRLPARNMEELVAYAKSRPQGLSYGSPGIGTGSHFAAEAFGAAYGVRMLHVPYKGSAPALQAVMAGDVDCSFDGAARAQIAAGSVRGMATTSIRRDPTYDHLPTLDEEGMRGFDLVTWQALLGPAVLPKDVAQRLAAATAEVMKSEAFVARLRELGFNPVPGGASDLAGMIGVEVAKYRKLAHDLKISFD
ncbi:tripartite tricarboxylate transporter substrate binding protein [Variovorax sp. Sphag1AA]|uniref:Bug family tripartite tricarboxylate transporter substrate binding protein n=1 Tax=Variovorax sp. Sphag1AA TaxID=2587027 RepID=UPI00160D4010|nr:tripartite tricarboxylate transporter substrate binding protein [Variovorax sp. Sphag1AA]MBB3178733.1 tripartite-type tricarboxylate transporter receptor subunit TctC [Variovorax sp. Sphag1AA]